MGLTGEPTVHRADILCALAIVALAATFLGPALRPGYTLLPLGLESTIAPWHGQVSQPVQNPLLSDPFYSFYPRRHFFTASLQRGNYPLWNPYVLGGHPVLGDTAAQTFYPPNALAAMFLSAARALPLLAWFHLVLTGGSMFAFLRVLDVRHIPALFGAVAWMLNGNAVVWLENPHRLSSLAWLPAVFLFYELALQRPRLWPCVAAAGCYGLSVLGGHTQFALGNGLALAAYAAFRSFSDTLREDHLVSHPLILAAAVGVIGTGIGAVQLLPTYQFSRLSHRGPASTEVFLAGRWPLPHLLSLWVPDFFGNPVRVPYWGYRNYAEVTVYYGAFAVPLALVALTRTKELIGRFFSGMQVVVLLIAIGSPVAYVLAVLPWARYFRLISLIAYIPFFGAAAAAYGLDALLRAARQGERRSWVSLLTALLTLAGFTLLVMATQRPLVAEHWASVEPCLWRTALLWLAGIVCLLVIRGYPTAGATLAVMVLTIDLVTWGMPFNPVSPTDILYPSNEVTEILLEDDDVFRVLPLQGDRVVFGPNVLSVFDIQETGGYSSLLVSRYRELVKAIDDEVSVWWMRPNANMVVNSRFDSLFSMLNVKYVLAAHSLDQHTISVEVERKASTDSFIDLNAGDQITGRFVVHRPGLNRLDVPLVPWDRPAPESVRFRLWQGELNGDPVADLMVRGEDLTGQDVYTFFFAPVATSRGRTFFWSLEAVGGHAEAALRMYQAEGLASGRPALTAYSTQLQLVDVRSDVWIYRNPNTLPRAYPVHSVEVVPSSRLLQRLVSTRFDPWTEALLEEALPAEAAVAMEKPVIPRESSAQVIRYEDREVEVEAFMARSGVLVLSDTYYPGWRVWVDDQEAKLLRVNHALRGVVLSEGTHRVVFRFVPRVLQVGSAATATALVISVTVLLIDARRSRIQ